MHPTVIERYKSHRRQLKPVPAPPRSSSRTCLPKRQHEDKGIAFDGKGSLYLNIGAPSNARQSLTAAR
ncbi:MAG: hypothetical protein R2712_22205 [Vicinamibacterales bacterium]